MSDNQGFPWTPPDHTKCVDCGAGGELETWSEGTIAFVHGCFSMICRRCRLTRQLKHCREAAERIPALEAELESLA